MLLLLFYIIISINTDENIDILESVQYNNQNYTLITKEDIHWKIINNSNENIISPNFKIKDTIWYLYIFDIHIFLLY